jgi:hypothetical protein
MGCPIITLTPQRSSTRDFAVRVLEGFSHRLRRFRVIGRKKAFNLVGTGRHCWLPLQFSSEIREAVRQGLHRIVLFLLPPPDCGLDLLHAVCFFPGTLFLRMGSSKLCTRPVFPFEHLPVLY